MDKTAGQIPSTGSDWETMSLDQLKQEASKDPNFLKTSLFKWTMGSQFKEEPSLDLALRLIKCIPNKNAEDESVQKMLQVMERSGLVNKKEVGLMGRFMPSLATPNKALTDTLLEAINNGDEKIAQTLVEHGFPITDEMQIAAAEKGLDNVIKSMVARGIKVNNTRNSQGQPLISLACQNGHGEVVSALINAGEAKWTENDYHEACKKGHEGVIKVLLSAGAKPNQFFHESILTGNIKTVRALLKGGADIRSTYGEKQYYGPPLELAIQNGDKAMVQLLLNNKADLKQNSLAAGNVLQQACKAGHLEIAVLLWKGGGDQLVTPKVLKFILPNVFPESEFPGLANKIIESASSGTIDYEWEVHDWAHSMLSNPTFDKAKILDPYVFFSGIIKESGQSYGNVILSNLDKIQEKAAKDFILTKYGDEGKAWIKEIEKNQINLLWELDNKHFGLGAVFKKEDVPPLDLDPVKLLGQEIELLGSSLSDEVKDSLTRMLRILNTKGVNFAEFAKKNPADDIELMSSRSPEEIEKWFKLRLAELSHVVKAYGIGEEGGDREEKIRVLKQLAEMQKACITRWTRDIQQLYITCAKETTGEQVPEVMTLGDRLLERLRRDRSDIIFSEKLNLFDRNPHEPDYLSDLLGKTLDLRLDPSGEKSHDDLYFQKLFPEDDYLELTEEEINERVKEEMLARFYDIYSPGHLVVDLEDHINGLAKITETAARKGGSNLVNDPMEFEPSEITNWLLEHEAGKWKQEEYDQVKSRALAMEAEGKTIQEIRQFLEGYGISWGPESLEEAIEGLALEIGKLERSIAKDSAKVTQLEEQNQASSALSKLLNKNRVALEKLKKIDQSVKEANKDEEKMAILLSVGKIKNEDPLETALTPVVIKRAQQQQYFKSEAFDSRRLSIQLLRSVGAIKAIS